MTQTYHQERVGLVSTLPEDVDWQPFRAFPPSARLAVVVGEPTAPGPDVIRVGVPSGVKPRARRSKVTVGRGGSAGPTGRITRTTSRRKSNDSHERRPAEDP
jgi:hypothetical protein